MTEILYYPVVDCDADGTEKMAMIPCTDATTVKAQSRMWLEEMLPSYFRLYTADSHLTTDAFKIRCPKCGKLAVFFTLENDFINDAFFNVEDYIVGRLAKNFGRAEDDGFINGNSENAPTGILADQGGAEVGVTTKALTYDDVVKLFFSVKPEYRKNGVWLMNDETALALRTLKDADGNYIWNHANDTILGHKVCISEHMPGVESGSKPIAFGDFSYYWIVCRRPVSVRTLVEQFAMMDCIGYMGYEFLDGRLVRPEAIKVMHITA